MVCVVPSYRLSKARLRTLLLTAALWSAILETVISLIYMLSVFSFPGLSFLMCTYALLFALSFVAWLLTEPREAISHPGHVVDAAHAFRWLVDNAADYGGDPNQIFLAGHSAGAHLAMLLVFDTRFLREVGIEPEEVERRVKGVIGISGVYDIARLCSPFSHWKAFFASQFYGEPAFGNVRTLHVEASPATHLRPTRIPFLLMNAKFDHWLKVDAEELRAAMSSLGIDVQHRQLTTKTHRTIMSHIGHKTRDDTMPHIIEFLQRHVGRAQQDTLHLPSGQHAQAVQVLRRSRTDVAV